MKFRTEIESRRSRQPFGLSDRLLSVGSCFSQAIGNRLNEGGVDISVTPTGILFNPVSIGKTILRAYSEKPFTLDDLYRDSNGTFHALDFESRRQGTDSTQLLNALNHDFDEFRQRLREADCLLITFGTAWCFRHIPTDRIVGNCHKLPDCEFERQLCSVEEIVNLWLPILEMAPRTVFTVSPVRHLNNGLHGNTLSKSRLHLAIEELCDAIPRTEYFPAFEALNDDLRDYRFYADDMKHPSTVAEEYIFRLFAETYYSKNDIETIERQRRDNRIHKHRQIIGNSLKQ